MGQELWSRLRAAGRPVTFLDGDALRAVIAEDLGHSADNRRQSAMRNARLCRLLAEQGADVVCATISLFHEVQRWNRENIPGYREIYLRVPLDELRRRDSKGIYAGAQSGDLRDIVGLDVPAETPEKPDLVLDNYGALDVARAVDRILAVCDKQDVRVRRSRPVSSRLKRRRNLWKRWRRCCAMVAFCLRFDSRLAIGARTPLVYSLPSPLRPGVQTGSSCVAVHGARTASRRVQAGKYDSVLGVAGSAAVAEAIEQVIDSFADDGSDDDQIFVQPMLDRVAMAGVVFSRSPSGGPYFVINYDDRSGLTDRVTAGVGDNLKTFYCLKSRPDACPPSLAPVIALVSELETLLGCDAIDVEFAVGDDGQLYLLQVRPLAVDCQGGQRTRRWTPRRRYRAQGRAAQSPASLPARQPRDIRRHARLESSRNHRSAALAALVVPLLRTHHRRDLGLSAGQLWIPESSQFSAAGQLSRIALHRRACQLQLFRTARPSRRSRRPFGELLHRSSALRAASP